MLSFILYCGHGFSQEEAVLTDSSRVSKDTIHGMPRVNEAILALSYANGGIAFGLIYKRQITEKRFFRASLADIGFYQENNVPAFSNQFSTSYLRTTLRLTLGVEWRFKLHKRVWSYTGIDVLFGARFYGNKVRDPSLPVNEQIEKHYSLQAGLAFNSGIVVEVHEMIRIGLNLSPDVYYQYSPWEFNDGNGTNYKEENHVVATSFSSASVQATIIFHWPRKSR